MITRKQLETAAMFTVFRGPAVETSARHWALFDIGAPDAEVAAEARRRGIEYLGEEPEVFDEYRGEGDDQDAALEYLSHGGKLVKLPDTLTSKHWRLYVVAPIVEGM